MNNFGIDVLLLNAIIHTATAMYVYYKHRTLSLYVMIWIAYSIITIMGYYSVAILDVHYSHDPELGMHVAFEPYLFAYLTTLLLTSPFSKMDMSIVDFRKMNNKMIRNISSFITCVFFLRFVVCLIVYVYVTQYIGFGEAYVYSHEGGGSILSFSPLVAKLIWVSGMISNIFLPLYVVYNIQRLINSIGNITINLFCIFLAFAPEAIMAIASGAKGQLFFVAFNMLFYYFLFKQQLSPELNKKIKLLGIGVGILLSFGVIVITTDRINTMDSDDEESNQIIRYLGEPYPNLAWQYYGYVKEHPNGKRFFPEFFTPNPENLYGQGIYGKFDYWAPITGVNMALLKTFWGDWYLEFGFWGSFVAILALYFICRKLFLDKYWLLSNFSLVAFYYTRIIIQGCFTGAGIEGTYSHKTIIGLLLLSLFIKYCIRNKSL